MSAKESFLRTEKELKRLNSTVRSKIITNEHIGNSVFKNLRGEFDEDTIKVFVNDHFTAGYYSFLFIKQKMIKERIFDYRGVKKYGYIISTILHDIRVFAEYIGKKSDPSYVFFCWRKVNG